MADGLKAALCQAGHQAELIKVPAPEATLGQVIRSYLRFWRLDLRHFDLVITLKYPGWMVRCSRQVCYMCHRLRGLYDTYPGRLGWRAFLGRGAFGFPGPYARLVVRLLDAVGLSRRRVTHFFCISQTVKARGEYFPKGCYEPQVIYPPSSLSGLGEGRFEYFFTVSRLDAAKRVDLLVSAMVHVRENVRLVIAGDGPQRAYLEALAACDPRVQLVGPVSDERLAALYRDALAVLFVPYQEDFGLVTVEAMRCAKPVITCTDSGGPTELVKDGVNGYVCPPEARQLARRLSLLASNPKLAADMGREGLAMVSGITWDGVVKSLLEPYSFAALQFPKSRQNKRIICVLSPYGIFPPRGGGQSRIFHFYRHLAEYYNIVIVSVGNYDEAYRLKWLSEGLVEVRIPMTPAHSSRQWQLERDAGLPISDVALPLLVDESPMIREAVEHFLARADVVIASHPFLFGLIRRSARTRLVVYEAHNVETRLKRGPLSATRVGRRLWRLTRRIERRACRGSDVIWATCEHEARQLCEMFGVSSSKVWIVPNGVAVQGVTAGDESRRSAARSQLGLSDKPVVLFIASWHPPNLDALLFIASGLAPALPNVQFVVVGSVRDQYRSVFGEPEFPGNLRVTGTVDEAVKNQYLWAADVAINPVESGSGTNLKMFDYMAAGLPIVTTPVGARGIGVKDGSEAIICQRGLFAKRIELLLNDTALARRLGRSARRFVEERFDWRRIAGAAHERIELAIPSLLPCRFDATNQAMFLSGWYPPESWNGEFFFRWSNGRGRIVVHNPKAKARLCLELLKGAGTPKLEILVNGQPIESLSLEDGWRKIDVAIPRVVDGDAVQVELRTQSWRPADVSESDDVRALGIAVRSVELLV